MTAALTTWAVCGDAPFRGTPADALRLSIGKGQNLSVDISGIDQQLVGRLKPVYRDLIKIGAYVLGADSAVSRGDAEDADLGAKWHRQFRFRIAVETPEFWNQTAVREELARTLGFLSDDTFTFEFEQEKPTKGGGHQQLTFSGPEGRSFIHGDKVDEVVLLSGGLDSFAGAAEEIFTLKRKVILVSHKSSTKTISTQRQLFSHLDSLAVASGAPRPEHVSIRMSKNSPKLRVERTQRTRSFLFAGLAAAVGSLVGRRRVRFYENGIIAVHLPVSRQLVGAKGTRTAHPRVLDGFSQLFSRVAGAAFQVENPFAFKTRTDVLTDLAKTPAVAHIAETVSCAYVTKRKKEQPHCGVCSQCVDRRFAVLAAGLAQHDPESRYEVRLESDALPREADRRQVLEYITAGYRFSECPSPDDFLCSFGEATRPILSLAQERGLSPDAANQSLFELHKRHGASVAAVVASLLARNSKRIHDGDLPMTSLPMLIFQHGQERKNESAGSSSAPAYFLRRVGDHWQARYREGKEFSLEALAGVTFIATLLQRPGEIVTADFLLALHARSAEGEHEIQPLDGIDEATLIALRADLRQLKAERKRAEECADHAAVADCDSRIDPLNQLVQRVGRIFRRDHPTQKQREASGMVKREIEAAIRAIRKQSTPMADHLEKEVKAGVVAWYRDAGCRWSVSESEGVEDLPEIVGAAAPTSTPELVINLREPSVHFRGHKIPVHGRDSMQDQQFFVLAALATRPGETIAMADFPAIMKHLGWSDPRGPAPIAKTAAYKIRAALTIGLGCPKEELRAVIEVIPKHGMRLQLKPNQVLVVTKTSAELKSDSRALARG